MCPPIIGALLAPTGTAALAAAQGAAFGAGASALAASAGAATAATTAISLKTALSFAGQAFSAINSIQQQQAAREQAKRQNEIAFRNRLNQERLEGLRIRQVREREQAKMFQTSLEAKQARATVRTAAEGFGGGVLDRLVQDYFRQEGRYNSVILNNLEKETAASRQNYINFVTGQEANQKYVPKVDYVTTFASAALNFGNDYLNFKADEMERERQEKIANRNMGLIN